ncbi:MAG: hypothetical protein WCC48_07290, partial [Anaeromyxobacteraceae bacterium]
LRELGERCSAADDSARRLLARLFQGGAIFTRQGSRLGRELLLAHQQLLRAESLVWRAGDCDDSAPDESDALHQEAAALVDRSAQIIARCDASCARGQ